MKTASEARDCKDDPSICRFQCTKCGLSFDLKSWLQFFSHLNAIIVKAIFVLYFEISRMKP